MARIAHPALGTFVFFLVALALGVYFTFAAVQGDFGLFQRAEIDAEIRTMKAQLERVEAQVTEMENLSRRLSDDYLDLDLLDEQARTVLGLVRADEIVVR